MISMSFQRGVSRETYPVMTTTFSRRQKFFKVSGRAAWVTALMQVEFSMNFVSAGKTSIAPTFAVRTSTGPIPAEEVVADIMRSDAFERIKWGKKRRWAKVELMNQGGRRSG